MKNIYRICIIAFLFIGTSYNANAAIAYSLDNSCGAAQLTVWVTPDVDYSGAEAVWSPAVFTVSWPMTLGSGVLGTISNQSGFAFATAGALSNDGTNYYQKYAHSAGTTLAMTSGFSYEVTRIALVGGFGVFGTFEIPASTNVWIVANNGFSVFSNINSNQVTSPYGAASITNIPMFAGIFWDGVSWCGGTGTSQQPGSADAALACYVSGMGAVLTTAVATPAVVNKLIINTSSQLTINPGAGLTVSDSTVIKSAQGLVIAANSGGSGSFKQNPIPAKTVYISGGSVEVETYIKNIASVGSFQMHLIGPTVFDPAIAIPPSTGPGYVSLGAFDMQLNGTYAYRYRESTNTWINIWQPLDSIPRLGAIGLSDATGVSKTISLTGRLNTGTVTDPTTPPQWNPTITGGQGEGLYIFSNPYTCGLDLDYFWVDNEARLTPNLDFYTWEHENGTWGVWTADEFGGGLGFGTGNIGSADGKINPGQGFFAQLATTATQIRTTSSLASDNERVHIYTPFLKSDPSNFLRLTASGNLTKDELIIRFLETATAGYDIKKDADKWGSMYEEATEINTVTVDQYLLTVNALPLLVSGEMTNVPMDFKCGAEGTYTITASNIGSFDPGTEIWLEDLQVGGEWYSLNNNPVYEFTAGPNDVQSRFIVHFFGPTGIDDPQAEINSIRIYGYGHDAYIVNNGKETVKEYIAYDMMGRELHRGTLPNSTVNKVTIGNVPAYYIVKVITKEGRIYTDKVYITN